MRLFLAVNLPAALQSAIGLATAELRLIASDLAWVPDARVHLTLRFLGEQAEASVLPLSAAIDAVAARHMPTKAVVGGVGAFPNFRRPRVLWMGVDGVSVLALQRDVEAACVALGQPAEDRPFRPHLTLARVKRRPSIAELRRLELAAGQLRFTSALTVSSIDLMQSTSAKGGHRYVLLHRAQLYVSE